MKKKEITVATTESVAKTTKRKRKIVKEQKTEVKVAPVFTITVDLVNNDDVYIAIAEAKENINVNELVPAWLYVSPEEQDMLAKRELTMFAEAYTVKKKLPWYKRFVNYIKSLWK